MLLLVSACFWIALSVFAIIYASNVDKLQTLYINRNHKNLDKHLVWPMGIAVAPSGDILFADHDRIFRLRAFEELVEYEVVPNDHFGAIAFDHKKEFIYISSPDTHRILKLGWGDGVNTLSLAAGDWNVRTPVDGEASKARFRYPAAFVLDPREDGILYISDGYFDPGFDEIGYHQIRRYFLGNQTIDTLAGGKEIGFVDGYGKDARFATPRGLCIDPLSETIYVTDVINHAIRAINAITGKVSTLAGNGKCGFRNGPANISLFCAPYSILHDSNTNSLIISDRHNFLIRELTLNDMMTSTLIGNGIQGSYDGVGLDCQLSDVPFMAFDNNGDVIFSDSRSIRKMQRSSRLVITLTKCIGMGLADGVGGEAELSNPWTLALDSSQNSVIISDCGNNAVRKLDLKSFQLTTIAGLYGISGFKDGSLSDALFQGLTAVVIDKDGIIYACDESHIRVINGSRVSTLAGSVEPGFIDGNFSVSRFKSPSALVLDGDGNLIVADRLNFAIRRVLLKEELVETIAGNGVYGWRDGIGKNTQFSQVTSVAYDPLTGVIYVADQYNNFIRKIDPDLRVTTIIGNGWYGYKDGKGTSVQVNYPHQITVTNSSELYFADTNNNAIRKSSKTYDVSTFCGPSISRVRGGNCYPGLSGPFGVIYRSLDKSLIVADTLNNVVRQISTISGRSIIIAGFGASMTGSKRYGLKEPLGIAFDKETDSFYVSDTLNSVIVKIRNYDGGISIVAGSGRSGYFEGNGNLSDAEFWRPQSIAISLVKNSIFIADTWNNMIRRVNFDTKTAATVAGSGFPGNTVGSLMTSSFNQPSGIALDPMSESASKEILFVCDTLNHVIKRISISAKTVSIVIGKGVKGFTDGNGSVAAFNHPNDLLFDALGNLFISDTGNNAIRKWLRSNQTVKTLSNGTIKRPMGMSISEDQELLYVAESGRNAIVAINISVGNRRIPILEGIFLDEESKIQTSLINPTKVLYVPADPPYLTILDSGRNSIRKLFLKKSPTSTKISVVSSGSEDGNAGIFIATGLAVISICLATAWYIYRRKPYQTRSTAVNLKRIGDKGKCDASDTISRTLSTSQSVAIFVPGYLKIADLEKSILLGDALGRGGTAKILKGKLVNLELIDKHKLAEVAVKFVDDSIRNDQFLYEVAILSKLPSHPNIVSFIGYSDNPYRCIVMKIYQMSMKDLLEERKSSGATMDDRLCSACALGIAVGMDVIHGKEIIHFDLKPQNILIDVKPDLTFDCVICDFGFSAFQEDGERLLVAGMKKPGVLGITPRYAAPELFAARISSYDASGSTKKSSLLGYKVDIFSFAMTIYETATLQKPWKNVKDSWEIENRVLSGERPDITTSVSPLIKEIIEKSWKSEPSERPSFAEICSILRRK